jgi:zinc transporter, ZIP family
VLEAGLLSLIASSSLVIGGLVGAKVNLRDGPLGAIMAVGAGTLVGAVSFELTLPAFLDSRGVVLAVGLAAGALVYYFADQAVERGLSGDEAVGGRIALGAFLGGIPESVALGITAVSGANVSVAFMAAVLISNLPESMSSKPDFLKAGRSQRSVLLLWSGIAVASAVAAALGYVLLRDASEGILALVQTFAAGSVLTMLATAMIPEGYKKAGLHAGLWFVLGFAIATLLAVAEDA